MASNQHKVRLGLDRTLANELGNYTKPGMLTELIHKICSDWLIDQEVTAQLKTAFKETK